MKTPSPPRLIIRVALFAAFAISTITIQAQVPSVSSYRGTPSEVEKDNPRVTQIIEKAENHFKLGKLHLGENKQDAARDQFDEAIDVILEAGMNVRSNPRLQNYYLELVERIYREEVPQQHRSAQGIELAQNTPALNGATVVPAAAQQPQTGFLREQKFEPSPLDELSRLELTPEEKDVKPEDVAELETEKNSVDFAFNSNALIRQFINYYQGRGRSTMVTGLRRSGQFMSMARQIFREEGVPEDIVWLGQVESAWRPTARSWAAASGLWQFIPGTGARFGLRQTAWVDERNSFEKATRASARYLKWLAKRYNGNWELALGAYNTGEGNIDRAIARAGSADFWRVYPYIAQETRNYVPNILATILIAKNPEKYGFQGIQPMSPLAYDVVSVPTATNLSLIASATDTSVDYLRSINPELRRDVTPRGEAYHVRVPGGRGKNFVALLKRIPIDRRESARIISVAAGEDLPAVAARIGASASQLEQWNKGVDLKAGAKLVAPAGSVRNVALVRARPSTTAASGSSLIKVRAQAGETLARLAARYNAPVDEVARLNGVAADAELQAGREVRIPSQAPAAPATKRSRRR